VTARKERFQVAADDAGMRLDQLLAKRIGGLSRRKARVMIDLGAVSVDRSRVKVASRPMRPGQVVEAVFGAALERDPEDLPAPRIVFEDDDVIVVDKAPGVVTAPTPESDRGNLLDQLTRRDTGPVWLVHRIDRMTSGLLVFARTPEANRALADRFAGHDVEREYVAVVAGSVGDAAITIDREIDGRRAVTHVRVTERLATATVIAARLETGRTHQIRIHAAGIGHPVLGDPQHGGDVVRSFRPRAPRMALHAALLGFVHPRTGAPVRFEAPLPDDLAGFVARLRRGDDVEVPRLDDDGAGRQPVVDERDHLGAGEQGLERAEVGAADDDRDVP
jgi:23S rRNA pseudouridine1911/1915/1917 synthase